MKSKVQKPWKQLTKEQKRSAKINVNGRKLRALDYIDELDRSLPRMLNNQDKDAEGNMKPVNHKFVMRLLFMEHGAQAVHNYVKEIQAIYDEQIERLKNLSLKDEKATGENNS